jgi:tryptophan synthase alpha chain
LIDESTNSFIYAVSVTGVTGERDQLPPETKQFLTRLRQETRHPVLVGFGVSNPQTARNISQLSDGVIIGSAVIRRIAASADLTTAKKEVFEFVQQIKIAL